MKYELYGESKLVTIPPRDPDSHHPLVVVEVRRIRALQDFVVKSCGETARITRGEVGGYVQSLRNLGRGPCWVFPGAVVAQNARVRKNATVRGTALDGSITTFIVGDALVGGSADVVDSSIMEYAGVTDNAAVVNSMVCGHAMISGAALVSGSEVCGRATISGRSKFFNSKACENAGVYERSIVTDGVTLAGDVALFGRSRVIGAVRLLSGDLRNCRVMNK